MSKQISFDFLVRFVVENLDQLTKEQLDALNVQTSFELQERALDDHLIANSGAHMDV